MLKLWAVAAAAAADGAGSIRLTRLVDVVLVLVRYYERFGTKLLVLW